jgi:hypothetical protein
MVIQKRMLIAALTRAASELRQILALIRQADKGDNARQHGQRRSSANSPALASFSLGLGWLSMPARLGTRLIALVALMLHWLKGAPCRMRGA